MHIRNQLNSIKSNVSADAVDLYPATALARRLRLASITIASLPLPLRASARRPP